MNARPRLLVALGLAFWASPLWVIVARTVVGPRLLPAVAVFWIMVAVILVMLLGFRLMMRGLDVMAHDRDNDGGLPRVDVRTKR